MIQFTASDKDDRDFVSLVQSVIQGAVRGTLPDEVYVVCIDNWFDHKWLRFGGTVAPQIGSCPQDIVVPPFVLNRVISETHYSLLRDSQTYSPTQAPHRLHRKQSSGENLQRRIRYVAESGAFFWYSSNTKANGKGSLLAYLSSDGGCHGWYAGFVSGPWRVHRCKGTLPAEVLKLAELSDPQG